MNKIEYRVAVFQQGRVTHDGANWVGSIPPHEEAAIDTCPELDDFLNGLGAEGWDLCGTVPMAAGQAAKLIFKRPASGGGFG